MRICNFSDAFSFRFPCFLPKVLIKKQKYVSFRDNTTCTNLHQVCTQFAAKLTKCSAVERKNLNINYRFFRHNRTPGVREIFQFVLVIRKMEWTMGYLILWNSEQTLISIPHRPSVKVLILTRMRNFFIKNANLVRGVPRITDVVLHWLLITILAWHIFYVSHCIVAFPIWNILEYQLHLELYHCTPYFHISNRNEMKQPTWFARAMCEKNWYVWTINEIWDLRFNCSIIGMLCRSVSI